MPYRALLYTMVTLGLAFLAIGMWVRAATPMLAEVNASTQASATHPAASFPAKPSESSERPDRQFKGILRASMMLSFLAVCILLAIGFFATMREWVRYRMDAPERKRRRTRYVDAWKIAGERMAADPGEQENGTQDSPESP